MATIASLNVALGADITGLRRGFRDAVRDAQVFARSLKSVTPTLGASNVRRVVSDLKVQLDEEISRAKFDMAKGIISPAQFRVAAVESGEAFNKALIGEMAKLEAVGKLSPALRGELLDEFKSIGRDVGAQMQAEVVNAMSAIDESALAKMGESFQRVGRRLTVMVTTPLVTLGTIGVRLAAEAEQVSLEFARTFGQATEKMDRSLRELHATLPIVHDDFRKMAVTLGGTLIALRVAPDAAADMSAELIQLAADFALLRRTNPEEEVEKLRRALVAGGRGLVDFGIKLDENTIEAVAFQLGIAKQGEALTGAQRALTVYRVLMERTTDVQNLAAESAALSGRQFRFLKRDLEDAAQAFGESLIPVLLPVVRVLTQMAQAFSALKPETRDFIAKVAIFAAILGPVLILFGKLIGVVVGVMKALIAFKLIGILGLASVLTPAGLLAIGLTALAGVWLFNVIEKFIDAQMAAAKFRDELNRLSIAQRVFLAEDLGRELVTLKRQRDALANAPAGIGRVAAAVRIRDLRELDDKIKDTQGKLDDIKKMAPFGPMGASADEASGALGRLNADLDLLGDRLNKPGKTAQTLDDRLRNLIATYRDMAAGGLAVVGVADDLVAAYRDVERQLAAALKVDPLSERASTLRAVLRELRDIPEVALRLRLDGGELRMRAEAEIDRLRTAAAAMPPLDIQATVRPIIDDETRSAARRLRLVLPIEFDTAAIRAELVTLAQLQTQLDAARVGGNREQIIALEDRYHDQLDLTRRKVIALAQSIASGTLDVEQQRLAVEALNAALGKLGATKPGAGLANMAGKLREIVGMARGLLGVAEAMGSIGDRARQTLTDIVNVASAMEDVSMAVAAQQAGTGSGFGVAAAGFGLLGAVIGAFTAGLERDRQLRQEANKIIRENNQRLNEVRLELAGINIEGLASWSGASAGISRVLGEMPPFVRDFRVRQDRVGGGRWAVDRSVFDRWLAESRTTWAEIEAIAREANIEIRDSEGNIIRKAVEQLGLYLAAAGAAAARFGKSLQDQAAALTLYNRAFSVADTPQQALQDSIELLRRTAPDLWEEFFKGVDPTDAAAVRKAIQEITTALLAGSIEWEKFGDLLGADELSQVLNGMLDGLDRLADAANETADAANEAVRALLNIPTGFRIARARFLATAPERFGPDGPINTPPIGPPIGMGGISMVFGPGAVIIEAGDRDPEALFSAVARVAKNKTRSISFTLPASAAFDQ